MSFTAALIEVMRRKNLRPVDIVTPGIDAPYLSRLLNHKVKDPTWDKAQLIIDQLGVDCEEFRQIELQLDNEEKK